MIGNHDDHGSISGIWYFSPKTFLADKQMSKSG